MHRKARSAALAAALSVTALMASACGTETPGNGGPATRAAVGTLEEARTAWAASGASTGEYRLRLIRSCFCQPVMVETSVQAGKVVESTASSPAELGGNGAVVPDDQVAGMPRTVAELHDLIEKETPGAHVLRVAYDSQGVPLSIWVDPIENAVDDEYGYDVSFASPDVDADIPADDGTWKPAQLPAGATWPVEMPVLSNAQAMLTTSDGTTTVHLGLWGSSSCPQVPRAVTWLTGSGEPAAMGGTAGTVVGIVEVDGTQPPGTACTEDYGPTTYATDVPGGLLAPLPDGSTERVLPLLVEVVTGDASDPGYQSYVVQALPRT